MDDFTKWFDQNSGYALHHLRGKPLTDCCKNSLDAQGKQINLPSAAKPLPLFRCRKCGAYYVPAPNGFYKIENLLKYRVESISPQKK